MSEEVKSSLMAEIANVFTYYDSRISNLEKEIEIQRKEIDELETECGYLNKKNEDLKEELANFSKVSIIKSLNVTLSEKDNRIRFLETQLKIINEKLDKLNKSGFQVLETPVTNVKLIGDEEKAAEDNDDDGTPTQQSSDEENRDTTPTNEEEGEADAEEEEEDNEEEEEEDNEEEVEVEFIEKKLKGKMYYVTDDEDREIYEKLEDGDVGELVGKYNDKNRPVFYKKK
jgi:uncharacterized coiled-coil protein SlyX